MFCAWTLGHMRNNELREIAAGKFRLVIRQALPTERKVLEVRCQKGLLTKDICQDWSVPILLADTKVDYMSF